MPDNDTLPMDSGDFDPPPIPVGISPDVRLQLEMQTWSTKVLVRDGQRRTREIRDAMERHEERAEARKAEVLDRVAPKPGEGWLAKVFASALLKNPAAQLVIASAAGTAMTSIVGAVLYVLFHWTGLPSTPTPVDVREVPPVAAG